METSNLHKNDPAYWAGNWKKFEDFAWKNAREVDNPDDWMIVYTSRRDADLLTESNNAITTKIMNPYTNEAVPDVMTEKHDHPITGWMSGFSIRVYDTDRKPTLAFLAYMDILFELEKYPVLDEDDYCQRQHMAAIDNIEGEAIWYIRTHDDKLPHPITDNQEYNLAVAIRTAIMSADDFDPGGCDGNGYYPSPDEIEAAFEVAVKTLSEISDDI